VRVVLTQEPELGIPLYRALYTSGSIVGLPSVDVAIDANSGAPPASDVQFALARLQARTALGGPVVLISANAFWRSDSPPQFTGFGVDRPVSMFYAFMRSDQDDRRTVSVSFGERSQVSVGQTTVRPTPLPETSDVPSVFALVETMGGRQVREGWAREGTPQWTASAFIIAQVGSAPFVRVEYLRAFPLQGGAEFRYDIATGQVTRTR